MAKASLAIHYRPQTFARVVGQDMVKSILSRAAQDDRVAPAYLLSGTRGVGKTTIARIFAKALNCANAPTGEPCNECEPCRRITQGGFVDVVEIDGASNRGIDDVRRLREAVGYAPLEGRYKVFIIDEAHMLTKEAFNALLKTLEEPPARVTFILATTEQHKFPVTIVSRCQHFVFRQIPESTLEAHVVDILTRENRIFEPEAARLIARRAAGSVRDAMSLLGQALALGDDDDPLTAHKTRDVLGLAGQEVMDRLLDCLSRQDVLGVAALVRELLARGADMGFFLRELGTLWRNLFLLRQAGPAAAADLDLPEADAKRLGEAAARFSLTYIHAAWQMTLDGQRRILTSLEPAAGLELLLLNLALLPRLLPLGELNTGGLAPVPAPPPPPENKSGPDDSGAAPPPPSSPSSASGGTQASSHTPGSSSDMHAPGFAAELSVSEPSVSEPDSAGLSMPAYLLEETPPPELEEFSPAPDLMPAFFQDGPQSETGPASPEPPESADASADTPVDASLDTPVDASLPWTGFLAFCSGQDEVPLPMLSQFAGEVHGNSLILRARSQVMFNQMQRPQLLKTLEKLSAAWAERPLHLVFLPPLRERRTEAENRAELLEHPVVQSLQTLFDATLLRCTPSSDIR